MIEINSDKLIPFLGLLAAGIINYTTLFYGERILKYLSKAFGEKLIGYILGLIIFIFILGLFLIILLQSEAVIVR